MGFGTDGVTVHSFSGNERVVLSKFSWRQLDRIFFEVHVFLTCSHGNMVTCATLSPRITKWCFPLMVAIPVPTTLEATRGKFQLLDSDGGVCWHSAVDAVDVHAMNFRVVSGTHVTVCVLSPGHTTCGTSQSCCTGSHCTQGVARRGGEWSSSSRQWTRKVG